MSPPPILVTVDRRGRGEFGTGWQAARELADTLLRAKVQSMLIDINEDLRRTLSKWSSSPLFVLADTFAADSPNRKRHPHPFGLRSALEEYGRSYIGSTYDAFRSASSADKVIARARLARHVTLPDAVVLEHKEVDRAVEDVMVALAFPVVVKRARHAGASIGVEYARGQDELRTILRERFANDAVTLVEEYVAGREFSVWILELGDAPEAFGVVEIHKRTSLLTQCGKVLGRPGRRARSLTEPAFETPPRISSVLRRRVEHAAIESHIALGLRHYSRVDLVLRHGIPYVLDVNARPQISAAALEYVARRRGTTHEAVLRRLVQRHLPELGRV